MEARKYGFVTSVGSTFLLLCCNVLAQTSSQAHGSQAAPVIATSTAQPANARVRVTYSQGLLEIEADNSSLDHILREIISITGMKITGSVQDERVYGQYGPAKPSVVLATLLAGTGSNLMIIEGTSLTPTELILTPRQGEPTHPSLGSAVASADGSHGVPTVSPREAQAPVTGQAGGVGTSTAADDGVRPPSPPRFTPQQLYQRSIDLQTQQMQARGR